MTTYQSTLAEDAAADLKSLSEANLAYAAAFPGDLPTRQPVHTIYGGAQLFKAETGQRLGQLALRALDDFGPDAFSFARAVGMEGAQELPTTLDTQAPLVARFKADPKAFEGEHRAAWLALTVYERVRAKLEREAVEDMRIDFEDGFGNRPDAEEDEVAVRAAKELAKAMAEGIVPPFVGIRIKPLNEELKLRAVRTLDLFITTLVQTAGKLPEGFVVTLPKVPVPEQVTALVRLFERLESRLGLEPKSLKLELMVELTATFFDRFGNNNLPLLLQAAEGRCSGAHFGTYDYTASCNITAAYQTMDHPACDFAVLLMKNCFANTGVFLSDGATNIMPVGPHRAAAGEALTAQQQRENVEAVHRAWAIAYGHIQRSLRLGVYQGWDLHPAQLPVRYAALYAFFLSGFSAAAERLGNFIDKAAQATLVGNVFDDAATGQGLLNYFLRGLACGAVSLPELKVTGLTEEEMLLRSFAKILDARTARGH
ncbi:MAG: phosphoenolpyruvate kinase [Polyangiaceae bacterium]|nr:phosphoenolpyruvate kinase [Polyangiaceae bacterium]